VESREPVLSHRMRVTTAQLPEPRALLRGVYAGRFLLVAALLISVLWGGGTTAALWDPAGVVFAVTAAVTLASFWYSHRRGRPPGEGFLYGQAIFDTVLLTVIVVLTGGPQSLFAPLYILVICVAALLLPALGGILVALLAMVLYFASVWFGPGAMEPTVLLHLLLFGVVALVTGYLADRLRQTGAALGEVQTELRLLRLDTGDILSTISTGILTVDGEGRLAYLNPAAEELLSLTAAEWLDRPILDRLDGIAPGLGSVIARSAAERIAVRRFETEAEADDAFVLGVSTTLVERPGGVVPAVTAIFQDITQKKRVEALRRRAERLEAVAELSASLAHEIKNPLASIRSAVEQISSDSIDPDDSRLLKTLVVRESDRLSRLLTEFIDFARVKLTAPAPVDFPAVVQEVAELARAHPDAEGRTVRVSVRGAPEHLWLRGAEDLLHRAVWNLVLNGLQWTGPDGAVELAIDEVESDLLSPALGTSGLVRLTVTDTGPGIEEEIREHIFDPFFTRRTGGTGLGLALVQRTVEAHGGAIFVDNAPAGSPHGATFTLYLPALPPDSGEPAIFTSADEASLF
jgi:two-component system sensor histidine kinase PilS (NtrC family)